MIGTSFATALAALAAAALSTSTLAASALSTAALTASTLSRIAGTVHTILVVTVVIVTAEQTLDICAECSVVCSSWNYEERLFNLVMCFSLLFRQSSHHEGCREETSHNELHSQRPKPKYEAKRTIRGQCEISEVFRQTGRKRQPANLGVALLVRRLRRSKLQSTDDNYYNQSSPDLLYCRPTVAERRKWGVIRTLEETRVCLETRDNNVIGGCSRDRSEIFQGVYKSRLPIISRRLILEVKI